MDNSHGTKTNGSSVNFEIVASMEPGQMDDDFGSGWKVCTQCGDEKPLSEFHKGKVACKVCRSIKKDYVKPKQARHDMIQAALEAAAYRIIKESM